MIRTITLLLMLMPLAVPAQDAKHRLTITVGNKNGRPVPGATITIQENNGKVLENLSADSLGKALFHSESKALRLQVTHVGYIPYQVKLDLSSDTTLALLLKEANGELASVTITGQKPAVIMEPDRYIITIDGKTTVGNTALEILKKAPGITLTEEEVLLEGKPVMVQVNGKTMPLTRKELIAHLSSRSATGLSQIELITTPPSSYDASLSGGLINLKTKKLAGNGYNGSASFTAGFRSQDPNMGSSLNLNFRKGKFNLFGNVSQYDGKQRSRGTDIRRFSPGGTISLLQEKNYQVSRSFGLSYTAGLDFYLNKNNIIGFQWNGGSNSIQGDLFGSSSIFLGETLDSLRELHFLSERKWWINSYNFNYKTFLDSLGQEVNFDFDADFISNNNEGDQFYDYLLPNGATYRNRSTILQRVNSNSRLFGFKADYLKPFRNLKLETGIKYTDSHIEHHLDESRTADSWNLKMGDLFRYKENIFAVHAGISGKVKDISYRVGLRSELTEIKGNSAGQQMNLSDTYLNLFPTVSLSRALDKKNSLSFTYRQNIVRPRFSQLNPFRYNVTPFFYYTGNTELRSYYPHSLRLAHSYSNFLQTSISYTYSSNRILEYSVSDAAPGTTKRIIENNGNHHSVSFSSSFYKNLVKWWYINNTVNFFYTNLQFLASNKPVTQTAAGVSINASQRFTISKQLQAELYFFGSSAANYGVSIYKPYWYMDMSFYLQAFKGKGQVSFSVRDLFYTNISRYNLEYADINYSVENRWDSRNFLLSFFYRFGSKEVKAQRSRNNTANNDIRSRIN
jgi:hypothetical protein